MEKRGKVNVKDIVTFLPVAGASFIGLMYYIYVKPNLFFVFLFFVPALLLAIIWDATIVMRGLKSRKQSSKETI